VAFETVDELRADVLWLAGEPGDGSSDFHERAVDYLNAALDAVISGGPLGGAVLPIVDWLWARRTGFLTIQPAFESQALLAKGLALAIGVPDTSTVGYRLRFSNPSAGPFSPRVLSITETGFVMVSAWPGRPDGSLAAVVSDYRATKEYYSLPSDLVRLVSRPEDRFSRAFLDVGTEADRDPDSPPSRAALVDQTTLQIVGSAPEARVYEFWYTAQPTPLADGGSDPVVPLRHRRLLSYGAAYLILLDKKDDASATVYQQFASQWDAMERDQHRNFRNASSRYGRLVSSAPGAWRTGMRW
jgi:hypothetical protein